MGTTKNNIVGGSLSLPFRLLVQGHTEQVHALAAHPHQPQFLSGGHDKCLILWDSLSNSAIWAAEFEDPIQSCCFSPGELCYVGGVVVLWGLKSGCGLFIKRWDKNNSGRNPGGVVGCLQLDKRNNLSP